MNVQSEFHDLLCEFVYHWQCPTCKAKNIVSVRSPLSQFVIRRCRDCETEHHIPLDMKGAQAHKERLIKKFGAVILSSLIPGY